MSKIFVTKSFIPPLDEYTAYLEKIWERGILTNQGPCVKELEQKIKDFLGVEHLHFLGNGTVALQLALSSLDIRAGEIITTPFSYVATTSSILWERCTPIFVDIEPGNFTIDPQKIEAAITPDTKAIMAVHVFGYACDVHAIEAIAKKHNLKVIYDGAHAFGVQYKGKSLLAYGDVSTLSFHATKLFHSAEGGACVCNNETVSSKLDLQKRFGQVNEDQLCLGVNAKQSELHAAMGLACFPYIEHIVAERKRVSALYDKYLQGLVVRPSMQEELQYNYAYYPVLFKDEPQLLQVFDALSKVEIYPRRYFYPSLNKLDYVTYSPCPTSESIASRIACLPLYPSLSSEDVMKICKVIVTALQ